MRHTHTHLSMTHLGTTHLSMTNILPAVMTGTPGQQQLMHLPWLLVFVKNHAIIHPVIHSFLCLLLCSFCLYASLLLDSDSRSYVWCIQGRVQTIELA